MKRRVIQLVLLLMAGAIVNVAVAWVVALFPMPKNTSYKHYERSDFPSSGRQTWIRAFPAETCIRQVNGSMNINWALGHSPKYVDESTYRQLLPKWSIFNLHEPAVAAELPNDQPCFIQFEERAIGWPMLSVIDMEIARNYFTTKEYKASTTSLPLPNGAVAWLRRVGARTEIPWIPLWPGFAINTIFYAAILWVVFFVPGMVRRRIRRRRGLCPACAYPIGTSPVCTECGNQIPFPLRGRAREGVGRTETSNAHDDAERSTHPLAPSLKGGGKDPA